MPSIGKDMDKTARDITKDLTRLAEDAAYVAIGFGVLGFQRAQVRRREMAKRLEKQLAGMEMPIGDARRELSKTLKELDRQLEQVIERLDSALEPVSQRLPATAQAMVHQARETRDQLRHYIVSSAA